MEDNYETILSNAITLNDKLRDKIKSGNSAHSAQFDDLSNIINETNYNRVNDMAEHYTQQANESIHFINQIVNVLTTQKQLWSEYKQTSEKMIKKINEIYRQKPLSQLAFKQIPQTQLETEMRHNPRVVDTMIRPYMPIEQVENMGMQNEDIRRGGKRRRPRRKTHRYRRH